MRLSLRPSLYLSLSLHPLFALALLGCSSNSNDAGPIDAGPGPDASSTVAADSLPCDVDAILAKNCRKCHSAPPSFGAPMPLLTFANLTSPAVSTPSKKVYELVGQRIHDDAAPMPQPPNPRLSVADTATLDAWIAAGAPAGHDVCSPTVAADAGVAAQSCTPDVHLKSASPWAMPPTEGSLYVCYGMDVTNASKRHVIGILPKVDNTKIVHHIVVTEMPDAVSPTPAACSPGSIGAGRIIYAWAPGGEAMQMPPEAGFPQEGTTHYMVQVHYNNAQGLSGEMDSSGIDLCTTDKLRANDADVLAFGSESFTIPAHGTLDMDCDYGVPAQLTYDLHIFGAMPHMHTLGKLMTTTRMRQGVAGVDLGSQPMWSFANQSWFPLDTTITGGDTIRTRCAWNNTTAAPVSYGENTSDEMCYSFTMYYPKIASPWTWEAPTQLSKCTPH